jgi:molybdopterin molybdotransferase
VQHCPDDGAQIEAAIRAAIADCNILIISGGVSVGARDLVKPSLAAVGAQLDLWRVAVKPGKPFLFGHAAECAIFGLPGNPVSAFVTFLLFVRPAVLRLMGASDELLDLPRVHARLAQTVSNDGDRPHYIRGLLRDAVFEPLGRQESHALFGLSRSNSMLLIPAGGKLSAGEMIAVAMFGCA